MSSSSLSLKMKNVLVECVMECSKMYSFDGLEALCRLGLVEEGSREVLVPVPLLEKVEEKSLLAPPLGKVEKVEKGRPKKEKKALEVQGVDLFAELIAESIGEVDEKVIPAAVEKKAKKSISAEKKEAIKAEKEAKKEAIKAEKEAKKEAIKAAKLAEKEAKAAKLATTKEAKKKEAKQSKKSVKNSTENLVENLAPPFPKVEEADIVKKFEYEGSNYLKSKKSGIIYNLEQEVVGKWNEETQKIDFEEEDDDSSDEE